MTKMKHSKPSVAPPTISSFIATPRTITAGQSTVLSGTVTGSATLALNGVAISALPVTVTPASTSPYTLTATNLKGSASATVTVTVQSAPNTLSLSITASDVADVLVYPADQSAAGDGTASGTPFVRTYAATQRVWLTAALRSGTKYFSKWQKGGVDYDTASTTTVLVDNAYAMAAIYVAAPSTGIAVTPGTDALRASMIANPGANTFLVGSGTDRFTQAITPASSVIIQGAAGATLKGSKVLSSFSVSGTHWIATGQTQEETQMTPGRPEMVYRDGVRLAPVATLAALATGTFYFDYVGDIIHLFDDPSGHTIEATVGCGGIIGFGGGNTNVQIRNLVIEQFGGGYIAGESHDCLKVTTTWLLEALEVRFASYGGVKNYGATTRNCYIHDNVQYGIGSGPGLIEGNVITNNNTGQYNIWNDAGGSKFLHTLNMTIRGNVVSNNFGQGLWSDFDNKTAVYENNRIENNTGMGIDNEVNCGAVIRWNMFRNNNAAGFSSFWNGGQIGSRGSCNVEIYGNDITADAGHHGLMIRADPAITYSSVQCGAIYAHDVSVHDNVFHLGSNSLVGFVGAGAGYCAANNITFSGNTYYVPDLSVAHWMYDGSLKTWAQWQAAGQDLTGQLILQ